LSYAQQVEIAPLPAHAAMLHLIQHSYIGRMSGQLLYPQQQIHFRQCVEIANRIPMADLKRPLALDLLPVVIQMVNEDSRDL
jgi:hypothetical protein